MALLANEDMNTDSQGRAIPIAAIAGDPQVVNLSTVSANIALSPRTHYRLWSSVDAFFKLGADASVVASTSSHPLTAKLDVLLYTLSTQSYLAAVVASGTGVLFISRLDAS